jgi:hypothetical protein
MSSRCAILDWCSASRDAFREVSLLVRAGDALEQDHSGDDTLFLSDMGGNKWDNG